mgnify:CR=1 FL=1
MTTLIRWSLPLLLASQLLSTAAVADTRQIEDAFGNPVSVPSAPQRVITLSELDLDAALALGITPVGTINGRGQAAPPHYLDSKVLSGIKVVGDIDNPNLETLLEQRQQQQPGRLIAIDGPTGLCADSGQPLGRVAACAALSLSIGLLKQGFLQDSALAWVGQLERIDLDQSLLEQSQAVGDAGPGGGAAD